MINKYVSSESPASMEFAWWVLGEIMWHSDDVSVDLMGYYYGKGM
jgi:hypothetical protein